MKPLFLFRHIACNKTGFLCQYLQERQIPYELTCVGPGERLDCDLDKASGLIFLGAPHSANGTEQWISDEIDLIQRAAAVNMPVMGVCFGAQLITRALGGEVLASGQTQIGWHPVRITEQGRVLMSRAGLPPVFHVFEWHEEAFSLPAGAIPLFCDDNTHSQGFLEGNILAMQFHLEVTEEIIEDSLIRFAECLPSANFCIQSSEQIRRDIPLHLASMHRVAERIYGWWLDKCLVPSLANGPVLAVASETRDNSPLIIDNSDQIDESSSKTVPLCRVDER